MTESAVSKIRCGRYNETEFLKPDPLLGFLEIKWYNNQRGELNV